MDDDPNDEDYRVAMHKSGVRLQEQQRNRDRELETPVSRLRDKLRSAQWGSQGANLEEAAESIAQWHHGHESLASDAAESLIRYFFEMYGPLCDPEWTASQSVDSLAALLPSPGGELIPVVTREKRQCPKCKSQANVTSTRRAFRYLKCTNEDCRHSFKESVQQSAVT